MAPISVLMVVSCQLTVDGNEKTSSQFNSVNRKPRTVNHQLHRSRPHDSGNCPNDDQGPMFISTVAFPHPLCLPWEEAESLVFTSMGYGEGGSRSELGKKSGERIWGPGDFDCYENKLCRVELSLAEKVRL